MKNIFCKGRKIQYLGTNYEWNGTLDKAVFNNAYTQARQYHTHIHPQRERERERQTACLTKN